MTAYSQFAPVDGKVVVEKDGKTEPVVGAVIEVYRTDIKGGFSPTKTNKKGEFYFAGMPYGAEYVFSVSAPNCAPLLFPNVKAGQQRLVITLYPGDGHKFTEAEARQGVAAAPAGGGGDTGASDDDKKAQAELEKKNAEIVAKNAKIEATNKQVRTLLSEGAAAFEAKNYDLAVAKFDEGYKADPEFAGSAPIMLTNKGKALIERGKAAYRQGMQGDSEAKKAAREKAQPDLIEAGESFDKAIVILEKAGGDPAAQAGFTRSKVDALKNYVEVKAVMAKMQLDPSTYADAGSILDKYFAAEADEAKKLGIVMAWSNTMREAGQTKMALQGYRILMEKTPENLDAIAGMGLSLYGEGVANGDKAQMQEGMNLMQKFADTAPETHPLKASVKQALDYLKTEEKMAPQKAPATPKKRN